MPRHDDERELEQLLRNAGAVVLLALFSIIVIAVVLSPGERAPDTTLLLAFASMALGGFGALVGVQLRVWRGQDDE